MKNIFPTLFIINLLSIACTKTGYDFTQNQGKDPAIEKMMDTASYSRWLPARLPYDYVGKIYKVISGTPRTLTADVVKNGKVLVFAKTGDMYKPYSLPFAHIYFVRYRHAMLIISRRTYFTYHVASITVYDSLILKTYRQDPAPYTVGSYSDFEFRCIIVPPALKVLANAAKLDWNDYNAVTSYFKIQP